jgi:hypothetical protein
MLRLFPLLVIPVALYSLFALGGVVVAGHDICGLLGAGHGIAIPMVSGGVWTANFGDGLVLLALVMLFAEIVRGARRPKGQIGNGLSMLVFVIALIEFITVRGFATSVFFFILAMALFDAVAGYTISIVAAGHGLGPAGADD